MPILGSTVSQEDLEQMLDYYKQNFDHVEIVWCSQCGDPLAFRLASVNGNMHGLALAEDGKALVTIGSKLQSWRIRLDETTTGEKMLGFQCECGNDTRIAAIERGKVPVASFQQSLSPFEKYQIAEQIRDDKKHKPAFKQSGDNKHYESFRVERVK